MFFSPLQIFDIAHGGRICEHEAVDPHSRFPHNSLKHLQSQILQSAMHWIISINPCKQALYSIAVAAGKKTVDRVPANLLST
jgi:hypothetical protein